MKFLLFLLIACSHSEQLRTPESVILSKKEQFQQCYHESDSYQGNKKFDALPVKLELTLNTKGKISSTKILLSSYKDANLHACLFGVIKSIKFNSPPSDYTFEINIPLESNI